MPRRAFHLAAHCACRREEGWCAKCACGRVRCGRGREPYDGGCAGRRGSPTATAVRRATAGSGGGQEEACVLELQQWDDGQAEGARTTDESPDEGPGAEHVAIVQAVMILG